MNLKKIDMYHVYNFLAENPDVMEAFPAQYFVVEQYPEDTPQEFINEPCIGIVERNGKSGAILIKDDNIINIPLCMTNQKRSLMVLEVPSVSEFINIDINTNISGKRLLTIYRHTCTISNLLNIETSPVYISKMESLGLTEVRYDEEGNVLENIVSIRLFGLGGMLYALAHELRHVWQTGRKEFCQNYHDDKEIGYYSYLVQPEEIDANAFANIYVKSIGYDLSVLFKNPFLDLSDLEPSFKHLRDDLITDRMNEIYLEKTA